MFCAFVPFFIFINNIIIIGKKMMMKNRKATAKLVELKKYIKLHSCSSQHQNGIS